MNAEALGLCRRLGLDIVRALPGREGASRAVLRVRNRDGLDLVLKAVAPGTRTGEVSVLRGAGGHGVFPAVVDEPEPGSYLMQWLPGQTLADAIPVEPHAFVAIGQTLCRLHQIPPPAGLPVMAGDFFRKRAGGWLSLPAALRAKGEELTASLEHSVIPENTLLHGDLVPSNIVLTAAGPRLIDPAGLLGAPAWDLAQLAVTYAGRGGQGMMRALIEGYGSTPPLLGEMLSWMILHYLNKNLADPQSPFSPNLWPLARHVVESTATEAILSEWMAGDTIGAEPGA